MLPRIDAVGDHWNSFVCFVDNVEVVHPIGVFTVQLSVDWLAVLVFYGQEDCEVIYAISQLIVR
jgi:hypothetical protein